MKSGKRSMRIMLAMPLAVFTVIGVLSYVPAAAQTLPGATATLAASDREILAGGQRAFAITVNQPPASGCGGLLEPACPPGINWVEIETPPGVAPASDITRQWVALSATAPSGWVVTPLAPAPNVTARVIRFTLPSGGATGNLSFAMTSTVPIPGADITKNWEVSVSSDGGNTSSYATGVLGTTVRVLRVPALTLTGPEKAVVTQKVTEFQEGITVDCTVENLGSRVITVTPSLNAPGFTTASTPAAQDIDPAGDTATFQFTLRAEDVSAQTNRTLTCNANGTNSEGASTTTSLNNRQFVLPVQPAAVFDYVKVVRPATFSPRAVAPEASPSFLVQIRKNPATSPGVDLDPDATKLTFKDDEGNTVHEVSLGAALDVPAGTISALVLTFDTALPAEMDTGVYDVSLDMLGEDKNGQGVSFVPVPSFDETLTIDAGIPIVDNLNIQGLTKPANFADSATVTGDEGYDDIERAARNGQPVPFSGDVLDGLDAESADPSPCAGGTGELQPGECEVTEALLFQFSDFDGTVLIPDAAIECPSVSINSSGQITGNCSGTFHADARAIVAKVTVEDAVGQLGSNNSLRVHIDNEIPDLLSAHAVRYTDETGAVRQNRIIVTANECVSLEGSLTGALASRAADWTATGNPVTDVDGPDCPDSTVEDDAGDVDGFSTIELTLQDDYEDDQDFGQLTYNPGCGTFCSQTNMQDRVRLQVPVKTLDILDAIAPLTPDISAVSVRDGRVLALQDGEFFTNTNMPTFRVIDPSGESRRAVRPGLTVEIWEETNGQDGLQRGDGAAFDTLRGSDEVDEDEPNTSCDDGVGLPDDTTEIDPCTIDIATDFSSDHPETGNADLDVYVVAHDQLPASLGGPNVSVEQQKGLNLDFVLPTLQAVTLESEKIIVSWSEVLPRGRNFAADWEAYTEDGLGRINFQSVALGATLSDRELNTSDPDYDGEDVGFVRYIYSGPSEGTPEQVQYEDRATNQALTTQLFCLSGGSASGIC